MELRESIIGEQVVADFLRARNADRVARRGEVVDALSCPAVLAIEGESLAGALTYKIDDDSCEIVTLHVSSQWEGVGTCLVRAVAELAVAARCMSYWVLTTNDNVDALRFYQRRGFRLSHARFGAVDDARRRLKPEIPLLGNFGIPLRDEIELSQELPSVWQSAVPGRFRQPI